MTTTRVYLCLAHDNIFFPAGKKITPARVWLDKLGSCKTEVKEWIQMMTMLAGFLLALCLTAEYCSHAVINIGIRDQHYEADSLLHQEVF